MDKADSRIQYYPIALKIKSKLAVVVGGGAVAERKVLSLLYAGARVRVVAPNFSSGLKLLGKKKLIDLALRCVRKDDLRGAVLVIAATNDCEVNKRVSCWARNMNILINVVDQPLLSDFISPAVLRTKSSVIAVNTEGRDPVLSRDLKNFLKGRWDEFISYRHRQQKSKS
jgi:precorrin-2 dehydrogenase/sirohydrochlorin ferrochelatase